MTHRPALGRRLVVVATLMLAAPLGACSGGIDRSEYVMPAVATDAPAPAPVVPVAPAGARTGRMPLLPPVPEEDHSGLPPVTVAQLLPPKVH